MRHYMLTTRFSAFARHAWERSRLFRAPLVAKSLRSVPQPLQVEGLEPRQLLAFMPWNEALTGPKLHLDRPYPAETGSFDTSAKQDVHFDRDNDRAFVPARAPHGDKGPKANDRSGDARPSEVDRRDAVRCQIIVICETTIHFQDTGSDSRSGARGSARYEPVGATVTTTSYRIAPAQDLLSAKSPLSSGNSGALSKPGTDAKANSSQDQPIRWTIPVLGIKQQVETLAVTNVTRTPNSVVFTLSPTRDTPKVETLAKETSTLKSPIAESKGSKSSATSISGSNSPSPILDSHVGLPTSGSYAGNLPISSLLLGSTKVSMLQSADLSTPAIHGRATYAAHSANSMVHTPGTSPLSVSIRDVQAAMFGLAINDLQSGGARELHEPSFNGSQTFSLASESSNWPFLNWASDLPRAHTRWLAQTPSRFDASESTSHDEGSPSDNGGLSVDERLDRWFSLELWDFDAQDASQQQIPAEEAEESDDEFWAVHEKSSGDEATSTDDAWAQWDDADHYGGLIVMSDPAVAHPSHRPDFDVSAGQQIAKQDEQRDHSLSFLELDSIIGNAQAFQVLQSSDAEATPTRQSTPTEESTELEADELTQSGPTTLETSALTITLLGFAARPSRRDREAGRGSRRASAPSAKSQDNHSAD